MYIITGNRFLKVKSAKYYPPRGGAPARLEWEAAGWGNQYPLTGAAAMDAWAQMLSHASVSIDAVGLLYEKEGDN